MTEQAAAADKQGFYERVLGQRRALVDDLKTMEDCQARVFREMLAQNADTEFGREHGFARIQTPADYARAVPIRDYDGLAPWLTRVAQGERNILTAEDPELFFMSSGTTAGTSKYIPVTPSFLRQAFLPFYQALWAPLLEHSPDILLRDDSTLNLKYDPRSGYHQTPSGKPHLGVSQVDFGRLLGAPFIEPGTRAPWSRLPVELPDDDHLGRVYVRLRIAAGHDLRCLIGFNPASVSALPVQIGAWAGRLIKDVHDGTVDGAPLLAADPERARLLERLRERTGTLLPSHLWPRMAAIYCWDTGIASLYMDEVARLFGPHVKVFPAPLAASEGPIACAYDRHKTGGHPIAYGCFLEFADADEELAAHSETRGQADLAVGSEYHVVLSHVGGFYRYAVGDVVRVLDRDGGVPRLEYAGRRTQSNLCGEQLRESQVIRALKSALEAGGLTVRNVSARPQALDGGRARYEVAIEPSFALLPGELDTLARDFDTRLCGLAGRYRGLRESGMLQETRLVAAAPGAFYREWERRVASGVRPPQVKDRMFQTDAAVWQRIAGPAAA